jgi:tRNA modification GTPase
MQGALEREVAQMIHMLSYDRLEALGRLGTLIGRSALGSRLVSGWRVVLAGRPNVGKSRLLNALAGYQRAIVDPTPGTTREGVTIRTAVDGWPVELTDTAGLRSAGDPIEAEGITMARARQAEADLVLLVLDRSEPLTTSDHALLAADPGRRLVVANKSDLPAAWIPGDDVSVTVSAERGEGIERLVGRLAARLVPAPPPPEAGIPFRPRHPRLLERARDALDGGDMALAHSSLSALIGERKRPRGSSGRPPA